MGWNKKGPCSNPVLLQQPNGSQENGLRQRRAYPHLSEEKRAAIMNMARGGFSDAHIARRYGVSEETISRGFSRQFPCGIPLDTVQSFSHIFWGSPGQVLLCLKSGHHGMLSRTRGPDVYPGFW